MARMKGPDGNSGLSIGGNSYEPDADGVVEIPEAAVADALCHGFTIMAEQADSSPADEPKPAKKSNGKKTDSAAA